MSLALLDEHGAGAFVCGRDRFAREILVRDDAAGVVATVECEDLLDGVLLPCLIAFLFKPENLFGGAPPRLKLAAARDELDDAALGVSIRRQLERCSEYVVSYAVESNRAHWRLLDRELDRRRRDKQAGRQRYDVDLRAGERLSIRPGPFARAAIAKAGLLKVVEKLHNQPVGHFALNALDWRMLASCSATASCRSRQASPRPSARSQRAPSAR